MDYTLQPVKGDRFRKEELDAVLAGIKENTNMILTGHEKIGKTSLLLSVSASLAEKGKYSPMIFSAKGCADLDGYIRRNLHEVLRSFPDAFPDPRELVESPLLGVDQKLASLHISDDAKTPLKLLLIHGHDRDADRSIVLQAFMDFIDVVSAENRKKAVVMFDDIQLLGSLKSGKSTAYDLLTLINRSSSIYVLTSTIGPGFEGFTELRLKPFSLGSTKSFFSTWDEESLAAVYRISEGLPFYLQFFGRWMKSSPSPLSISYILDEALKNELHFYFSERLGRLSPKELQILDCMAKHDVNSPSRISRILDYSQTNVRRFLCIMEEKGVVTLEGRGVFRIFDPVFREWLKRQI